MKLAPWWAYLVPFLALNYARAVLVDTSGAGDIALALATAALVPKLRYVLWGYAAAIAFTRLAYGAHFPSDVILGFVLGWLAVRTTIAPAALRRSTTTA